MAIKPSGDLDVATNTIVGSKKRVDWTYVHQNPYPDPEFLKNNIYTEAGAIIATIADCCASLHIANDFLLHKTSGDDVFKAVSDTIKICQTFTNCQSSTRDATFTVESSVCCSTCADCEQFSDICDSCTAEGYHSHLSQLRPCTRCVSQQLKCHKIIGVSMDCEANNAKAMNMLDGTDTTANDHLSLTNSFPDAVYAGKKLYRAVANWWLLVDGFHINNSIPRCLRQFSGDEDLRAAVSDLSLRNWDRMDYGAILECVDGTVAEVINRSPHSPRTYLSVMPLVIYYR